MRLVVEKPERFQVEVYDPKTKEVIRHLPPDEIIKLAESIEEMAGVIFTGSLEIISRPLAGIFVRQGFFLCMT